MSMSEWAKREVELACAREKKLCEEEPDVKAGKEEPGYEYGCACYNSALKAYLSLMEDDHSGYSFGVTANILKRLLDAMPLTPIEDVPEIWHLVLENDDKQSYQCTRRYSLFKDVDRKTGDVSYHDSDMFICIDERGGAYHSGFISRQLERMYPITFPYMPKGSYKVYASDFSTTGEPGTFDTIEVRGVKEPDGATNILNWYYKETDNGFVSIDEKEFTERKRQATESALGIKNDET